MSIQRTSRQLEIIRECVRLLLEVRRLRQLLNPLSTVVEEEEEEAVDSEAETVVLDDTVIYEGFDLIETFPPICPIQRQDAVPIGSSHARRY